MKTAAAIVLALSAIVADTAAQAQERQVTVYSGAMALELPTSILRGTTSSAQEAAQVATSARKVRVVLQSPYGS
ncbi:MULTISPECIES: hypothetical protein [Methylobacterium]|uniref:DUF4140 domain-containing protein n=1 Tax=Methylobacterium thuringiense TaxID=1003091 RepID=A0ABQ4TR41_9HYPH|nr:MULTISPECIES: hypothetical protein [Methylobacterium]TXN21038.1 hypothetical protein FV217_15905 [Methylobacterium sp. WL9]GJE57766.1 hypothetical protein EKPJFOCH_4284 [Methylobacterium thuringiense]